MLHYQVPHLLSYVLRNHDNADVVSLEHLLERCLYLVLSGVFVNHHEVGLSLPVSLTNASQQEACDCGFVSEDCDQERPLDSESLTLFRHLI